MPLYAISAKIEKNEIYLKKTETIYLELLSLYNKIPKNDDSLMSDLIKDFFEHFEKMTNNLSNSNVRFGEIIPSSLKIYKNSEIFDKQYIIYPKEKKIIELNEKQWEVENNNKSKNKREIENNIFHKYLEDDYISENNIKAVNISLNEFKKKRENKKQKSENQSFKEIEKGNENEQLIQNKDINKNNNNNKDLEDYIIKNKSKDKQENKEKQNENNNNNIKIKDDNQFQLNTDTTIKKETHIIKSNNFDEKIILQLIIDRMKEIEEKIKNNKYPLPELGIKKDLRGQCDYINEQSDCGNDLLLSKKLNVIELYQSGRLLAKKIVMEISKRKVPFSKISVNLLIDCSGYINIYNKLKQFTIICGIVNALNICNIKYAISLVGDSQFECTLKPFDVDHSMNKKF